ncbi:MAG: hypothetical protein KU37_10260 [Sulfuricurvum sp. PC08-66]|nr:MAG: hypothetical protein KU37_10260 [Sulfuricurvum sp. PC08-66]
MQTQAAPEKLHSWITLPSGEVIDLAFMTIYGLIYNEASLFGNLVAKMPSEFTGGMRYVPMMVGEDFLHCVAFVSEPLVTE